MTAKPLSTLVGWITVALITYVGWRLWTFSLLPRLHPHNARQKPYYLPYIGHALGFVRNNELIFSRSIEYFRGSQRPFALTLLGRRVYIVTALRDIQEVYKATANRSSDDVAQDFIRSMCSSEEGLRIFYDTPYQNNPPTGRHYSVLAHAGHDQLRQQLLPGKQLDVLWLKIQRLIFDSLERANIPHNDLSRPDGRQTCLPLYFWTTDCLFNALITAIFGPCLLEIEPSLACLYCQFEEELWKPN